MGRVYQSGQQLGLLADDLCTKWGELVVAAPGVMRGTGVTNLRLTDQLIGNQSGQRPVQRAWPQPNLPVRELINEPHHGVPVAVPGSQREQHLEAGRRQCRDTTCRTHSGRIQSVSDMTIMDISNTSIPTRAEGHIVITRVSKVIVPVADQQAALDFWTMGMGFELIRDDAYGNERWIEVRPPEQDLLLVLSPRRPDEPRRTVPDRLPHSDLFFGCADIESTHAELSARGVKFPLPPARQHFGWWALFEDNEGTRYALGQWSDADTASAS
jgi:lactoylglutathione lyase